MADPYQRGSDADWASAEAEELRHQLKRRTNQLWFERLVNLILVVALGWVVFKFLKDHKLDELWKL